MTHSIDRWSPEKATSAVSGFPARGCDGGFKHLANGELGVSLREPRWLRAEVSVRLFLAFVRLRYGNKRFDVTHG